MPVLQASPTRRQALPESTANSQKSNSQIHARARPAGEIIMRRSAEIDELILFQFTTTNATTPGGCGALIGFFSLTVSLSKKCMSHICPSSSLDYVVPQPQISAGTTHLRPVPRLHGTTLFPPSRRRPSPELLRRVFCGGGPRYTVTCK